jgi:hypothetical protein
VDELLKTAVGQAPSLVVLVIVVKFFLLSQKEMMQFIRQLHDEHIQARQQMEAAIHENTSAMRDVASALSMCPLKK